MTYKRNTASRAIAYSAALAVLWLTGAGNALFAQNAVVPVVNTTEPVPTVSPTKTQATTTATDSSVLQTGCSTCSKGLAPDLSILPTFGGGGCSSCGCGDGCGGNCVPGRTPCDCCFDESTACGRLFGGIYKCICCPDPCYEPHWNPLADSAFYQDGARPVTQMRLRFEDVWDYSFPDKAEYLWGKEGGKGQSFPAGLKGETAVSYRDLTLYNEVAIDRFSASIAIPYLQMSDNTFGGASGFGDMTIGTKTMLMDCELMQFSFAFDTIVPVGNFTKYLGTGHVSLEPGLLMSLKISPTTYVQSDLLYRIPIGGDAAFEGPVLQYHLSLNHLLWSCGNGIKVIGVAEMNGFELLGGSYTANPVTGAASSAKDIGSILSIGPGIRLVVCDKIDFGVGSAFNLTHDSMGDESIRVDFRWRF